MSDDGERGSGTVAVLAVVAVALVLAATLGVLVGGQARRVEAQSAADLGALAGAAGWRTGADGCASAARVVARNGGRLVSCVVEHGGVVRVVAARDTALGAVVARARAGPVSARRARDPVAVPP